MIRLAIPVADDMKTAVVPSHPTTPTTPTTMTTKCAIDDRLAWVPLYDGKYVDGILYQRVKLDLLDSIPGLPHGVNLPMKKICSPEFWEVLDNGEKRMAGRCLMHFVLNKEVKLKLVSRNASRVQLYCKT